MKATEWKTLAARAREIYAQGAPKSEIYAQLSAGVDKPLRVARIVTALPNPVSVELYKASNIFLAIVIFILAFVIGFAKFAQLADIAPVDVAVFMGLVFGSVFAGCAWGILCHSYSSYIAIAILFFIAIPSCLRGGLQILRSPDYDTPDNTFAGIMNLFVLPLLFIFLIWFTGRLRDNIFSKTGFLGKPIKDKSGAFQFDSAWELKAARAASKAAEKAQQKALKISG